MRRSIVLVALAATLLVPLAPPTSAETTRTLRIEVPASAARFAVENLAGAMRVVPGTGDTVVAVATVHAENDELAGAVRFEKVNAAAGVETFRVRYPYDRSTRYRYPGRAGKDGSGGWLGALLGGGTSTSYDDHRVKVSANSGVMVYADVEIQVPHQFIQGSFKNLVGRLEAADVEGKLDFDTGNGQIALDHVKGEVKADAGSGDVKASRLGGSFTCDTGSGDCTLDGFEGDAVRCDVGSGNVRLTSVTARRVFTDAGSGDVRAVDVDAEEFVTDSGSGNVELRTKGTRLVRVKSQAGSGDLTLRLGTDASFEAYADQGSGDIVNRYSDATPIVKEKEVIGYRRGSARTRIDFDAGSGNLILEPGS